MRDFKKFSKSCARFRPFVRPVGMRTKLKSVPGSPRTPDAGASAQVGAIGDQAAVQAVATSLDRVRDLNAQVGYATLIAELSMAPSEEICAVLDELALATERAYTALRVIEQTRAELHAPLAEILPIAAER